MRARAGVVVSVAVVFGWVASGAAAAVTPGWECIPTTAGAGGDVWGDGSVSIV